MKAVTINHYGPPHVLTLSEFERPKAGPAEILVCVAAAAVNPVDLAVRRGDIPSGVLPAIVGWDVVGTVVEVGANVRKFTVGDRVIAARSPIAHGDGVTAEYVALAEDLAAHAPANVPLEHAAALPLSGLTAEQALNELGADFSGRLLILGAAGSVGGYLVQLAAVRGWRPAAFARADDAKDVRDLGASAVFSDADMPPVGDFDAVIDAAGRADMVRAVRDYGRFVSLTPQSVPDSERSIAVQVYGIRTDGQMLDALARQVEHGSLRLRIARSFPFEAATQAHSQLEAGGTRGKILLTPDRQN